MFGQVAPTEYDLRFQLFGIPVRVHPVFWITSAMLAWDAQTSDLRVVLVRVLCLFLSVMVHELGHALANKVFGFNSEIVLYLFGGYATSTRHSTWKDVAVSAAGPFAGFALLGVIWLALLLTNLIVPGSTITEPIFNADAMQDWPSFLQVGSPGNRLLLTGIHFTLFINLVLNVMNLVPALPLDGGQISREICLWFSPYKGMEICLIISTLAAGGVALASILAFMNESDVLGLDPKFLGLMFGVLAVQSYQQYEQVRQGQRYW